MICSNKMECSWPRRLLQTAFSGKIRGDPRLLHSGVGDQMTNLDYHTLNESSL